MENTILPTPEITQNCETLLLNDYSFYTYERSIIDPSKYVKSELRLICPRCKFEQKCPQYGEKGRCPECGLVMYIHGSDLVCLPS